MRLGAALALSVLSAGLGASLVACFDLFHSTSGILDACQLDAEACSDASPPMDFCSWEGGTPQTAAAIACTWIATCEGRVDDADDFGECMVRATLAYDCSANPNNPVTGATKQGWVDLLRAKSCEDVNRVMFPGGMASCPGTGLGCDTVTRVACAQLGARPSGGENCALWSETCDSGPGCVGCLGCFAGPAAGVCTADASASCANDIATSCPNGWLEVIDCSRLLQQPYTCNAGPLRQGDPTSPCYLDAGSSEAGDDSGGCTEGCDGNTVTACTRGASLSFDCSSIDASCQPTNAGASCVFPQDQ